MTPARSARSKHALVCLLMGLSLALSSCVYMPIGPSGSRAPDAVGDGNQTAGSAGTPEASPAPPPPASYVLIIDASGSMKIADMVGGGDRMTAARDAAKRFVSELPEGSKVALVTYGDQTPEDAPRETSCEDATVKIPLGTARDGFAPLLDGLQPSGWTSISTALTKAAELAPAGERTSVVLVSDGEDSCAPPDPCDTAGDLVSKNAGLSISTIGVRANNTQLACIADRGRGISVTADSAAQLARRLLALSDPAAAADQLSPNGVQRIRPGTAYAAIKEQHPDFPALPESVESVIRVIWRNCAWEFDNQAILRGIVLNEGSTIDGIKLQDPAQILDGLGTPVQVDPVEGGELRYYAADERLGHCGVAPLVEHRGLTAHTRHVHAVELIDVDPRGPALRIPRTRADADVVAVMAALGARHPHRVDAVDRVPADDEHGPVLAAPVVLLIRHPRPDDLTRVGVAVAVRRVIDEHALDAVGVDRNRLSPRHPTVLGLEHRRTRCRPAPGLRVQRRPRPAAR